MESKGFDTMYTVAFVFVGLACIYFIARYYLGNKETFTVPQVSPPVKRPTPIAVPREVSPSGPNAPNARVSDEVARENDVYNIVPTDPTDEKYGSQDIKDSMRYPERMFGPGKKGTRDDIVVANGTGSTEMGPTVQAIQPYAADLVQNGAMFGNVSPDSSETPSYYSSF